jgi:hypothetical protein
LDSTLRKAKGKPDPGDAYPDFDYCYLLLVTTQKGPPMMHNQDVLGEVMDRLQFHIDLTRKQTYRYKYLARSLQVGIPVLAATLTIFASGKANLYCNNPNAYIFWLSGALTVCTIVNSTLTPYKRFADAAKYSAKFWAFHTALLLDIERTEIEEVHDHERHTLNELLHAKNNELGRLIEEFTEQTTMATEVEPKKG